MLSFFLFLLFALAPSLHACLRASRCCAARGGGGGGGGSASRRPPSPLPRHPSSPLPLPHRSPITPLNLGGYALAFAAVLVYNYRKSNSAKAGAAGGDKVRVCGVCVACMYVCVGGGAWGGSGGGVRRRAVSWAGVLSGTLLSHAHSPTPSAHPPTHPPTQKVVSVVSLPEPQNREGQPLLGASGGGAAAPARV